MDDNDQFEQAERAGFNPYDHTPGSPAKAVTPMADSDCVFCEIIAGHTPAKFVWRWDDAVAILPREKDGKRGCTEGHILVIPRVHVRDFTESSYISAITAARASELAYHLGGQWNELTSAGPDATQSVGHLHRHLVPRRDGDGLCLPWTGQAVAQ